MFIWIHSSNLHADHQLKYCFLTLTVMEVIQSGCLMKHWRYKTNTKTVLLNELSNSYKVMCEAFWPFWVTNDKKQNVPGKTWHLLIEYVGNETVFFKKKCNMISECRYFLKIATCSLAIWLWIYHQLPRNQLIQCHSGFCISLL